MTEQVVSQQYQQQGNGDLISQTTTTTTKQENVSSGELKETNNNNNKTKTAITKSEMATSAASSKVAEVADAKQRAENGQPPKLLPEISGSSHTVIDLQVSPTTTTTEASNVSVTTSNATNTNADAQEADIRGDSQSKRTSEQSIALLTINKQHLQPNEDRQTPTSKRVENKRVGEESVKGEEREAEDNKCVNQNIINATTTNLLATANQQQQQQQKYQQIHAPYCKRRRLSYLQSLLLRRWPCLALAICIMSSLIFGMLLSALTVYLMHGVTDCSGLALAETRRSSQEMPSVGGSGSAFTGRRPPEFESPLELASLTGASAELGPNSLGRHYAAPLTTPTGSGVSQPSSASQAGSNEGLRLLAEERAKFQRLPSTLWPQHYDLFIQPYIREPFNFTGKVSILMRCTEATDRITLHTLDLELNEATLKLRRISTNGNNQTTGSAPTIKGLSQNKDLQYSIVHLSSQLEVGAEYELSIDFRGHLNDDLAGFYKIRYDRANSNETTWIAATQFQATDARRAFPCFDEPLYKATFSIQIKHWKNMTALSNMPIIDRKDSPDGLWVTDTFSKSQRMSTYLVAYAVTNFESRSEGNISVWTRPGFVHTADYALRIAGKILRHYEDFFGIEYPLPKMDMIALPDFNAGAMENWGLITYRETAMLYDESSSSVANKQRVATVVAHELAHQWFGNLVTPKWWDDLWLNEGFASFVEYIGVDHVEPKWRMLDQFVVEEVQNVFKMDALSSSHQISIPVNNPDEISEIFDHISYSKGASIIRMMNHFLTEEVFKLGLRRYLRALKYSNAEQSDLWAHLTEARSLLPDNNQTSQQQFVDVGQVMNSWTLQTGFPLVTLTRNYDGSKTAQLEQTRYMPYKSQQQQNKTDLVQKVSSNNEQRWEIPITFTWKSEQNWKPMTRLWMHQNESSPVQLKNNQVPPSDDEWMLLNVNQVGYYRVNYDKRNWKMLIDQLIADHTKISPTNRAQILDDIFELARTGSLDYNFAMEATKYMREERDYLAWDTVLMSFSYIDDMLQRTPLYGDWKAYIAALTSPYYNRYKDIDWTRSGAGEQRSQIGSRLQSAAILDKKSSNGTTKSSGSEIVDKNDVLEHYNLVSAIAWACQVDDHCIQKAKSVFADWRNSGKNEIYPALRYTTYCTAIENGNKDDWDFLWRVYEKEQNASERDRIMRALGCSKEIWILSRYLEWTFSKSKQIRRQDGTYVFRMIAKNNYGRDIAFNFMRERWSTIKEFYGKTSFSLGNLVRSVANSMNTQIELNQLMLFYESIKHDVGTGKRSFQIAIEEVESNVLWRNKNYKIIEEWIQSAHGKMNS